MTLAFREVHVGDCRELLARMPDESVNCVVTSPPYWGLRDYGVEGQLGLEATPEEYVEKMVAVFREVRRVLRADGTLWLNLGDSYVTAPHGKGSTHDPKWPAGRDRAADRANRASFRRDGAEVAGPAHRSVAALKHKDMVGIPWRVAFALQADGWWLRRDIVWSKPNPMPESTRDRPTTAHEYVFLMTKSEIYAYDADAIKEPVTGNAHPRGDGLGRKDAPAGSGIRSNVSFNAAVTDLVSERNKRSVWTIATEPYPGSHFATFPRKLVEPCILAGCPAGGVVLDPFGGSGTVGEVAEALGRNWILLELKPEYAELARRRVAQRGLFVEVAS